MTDQELEQQLRAWYRAHVPEAERAPAALRLSLVSLTEAAPAVERRRPTGDWRPRVRLRLVPMSFAAAALIVALIVGLALLGDRPSMIGGPSPSPGATHGGASPTVMPSSATWRVTGSMSTRRWDHEAALLGDGKVLVVGGVDLGELASAELYVPDSGTWISAGAMSTPRSGHTLTPLADGTVLVAGGRDSRRPEGDEVLSLATVEVYDPVTEAWAATGSMTTERVRHSATRLDDGRVLVVGGLDTAGFTASAEIYDPSERVWTPTTDMSTARAGHAATLLADGTVLITGGSGTPATQGSAELYDPGTAAWSRVGDLSTGRFAPTATVLADGRVLVTGSMRSHGEIYDPGSGTWMRTKDAYWGCSDSTAVLLTDGNVLEMCTHDTQLYDPTADTWVLSASMNYSRYLATLTVLADGRVLAVGGQAVSDQGGVQASAELYDPGR